MLFLLRRLQIDPTTMTATNPTPSPIPTPILTTLLQPCIPLKPESEVPLALDVLVGSRLGFVSKGLLPVAVALLAPPDAEAVGAGVATTT